MTEKLVLTTAISYTQTIEYFVDRCDLNWRQAVIHIELHDNVDKRFEHSYYGSTALTLMIALNKANLSTKSLHKRIIEQLQADGILPAGSISGSPD